MSGEHFSGGPMPHEPLKHLPTELYDDVERNIVYACTDVALRDLVTGDLFLGSRQTEPQIGPWFVGGRDVYATGIRKNAALQVKHDLSMDFDETRFSLASTYSTDFPIAGPGREDHGRHTQNAVMLVDLKPEEVSRLNQQVETGKIRDEYSHGAWYKPSEIGKPESDFPYVIKQFVRDLFTHDMARLIILQVAHDENDARDVAKAEGVKQPVDQQQLERVEQLTDDFGFSHEEAEALEASGGAKATSAITWARSGAQRGEDALRSTLDAILADKALGDAQISRQLQEQGLARPDFTSDNGPALRAILRTAALALQINQEHDGAIFKRLDDQDVVAAQ